jgi:uncharacterized protein (DUF1778 family)
MTASAASARFEFRLRPDVKERIEYAAQLVRESVSDFARAAAEARAEQVLHEHSLTTTVPAAFFDSLLEALDSPSRPNDALTRASRRIDDVVTRR